jgi:hypothetical protein
MSRSTPTTGIVRPPIGPPSLILNFTATEPNMANNTKGTIDNGKLSAFYGMKNDSTPARLRSHRHSDIARLVHRESSYSV